MMYPYNIPTSISFLPDYTETFAKMMQYFALLFLLIVLTQICNIITENQYICLYGKSVIIKNEACMKVLTIHEQILLLAIWRLKDNAYGVRIRQSVAEETDMVYTYGTLYSSLEQLVKKGYVSKTIGEATAERGGRRKIYYNVSKEGMTALKEAKELQNTLWNGIPDMIFSEEK